MTSEKSQQHDYTVNQNFKSEIDARLFVKEIDALITERAKEETRQLVTSEKIVQELMNTKLDLIKWMFGFWVTLVMLILGAFFLKR